MLVHWLWSRCFLIRMVLRYDRAMDNGVEKMRGMPNGHHIEIMLLKWVLIRTIPELAAELRR